MVINARHLILPLVLASVAWSDEATVLRKLTQAASHLNVAGISASPVAGMHEVEIKEEMSRLYVTADGNYLFAGDVYAVLADGLVNLTEARREVQRQEVLAGLAAADMIVFAPTAGTKAVVYVFTDCPRATVKNAHPMYYESRAAIIRN